MFKKLFKILGIILILFIIITTFMFLFELRKTGGNKTQATIGVLQKVANTVIENEPIYVLLLGVNDNLGQNLTDTIMVMGYNPKTGKAFILSVPRDTFIGKNISYASASDKINSLYSSNPEKIMKKVEDITGIDLNYYVVINNKALIKIVDILGGVQFDVPIDMNYDDKSQNLHIHFKKGMQLIDGEKAEELLRFRHNNNGTSYSSEYGDNDYGRMRTQREFLLAIVKQCLETRSVDELSQIISVIFENLNTNLSLSYIVSYLISAYDFNIENLRLEQLPGKSVYSNQVW